MRGTLIASLAIILVSLAGCAKTPEATNGATPEEAAAIEAPLWVPGQYWDYKTTGGSNGASQISLVVTGSQGGDWIVDTNDATLAYYDALLDISYVGKISKSGLAGAQGADRIKFFDFPLELNKTWTTKWDGETVTLNVNEVGADGTVRIMAHNATSMTAQYAYNPTAMFFEFITFYAADGSEFFKMERSGHGQAYEGEVLRYTLDDAVVIETGPLSTKQVSQPFGEATELRILLHAFCNGDTAGQVLMGMGPKAEDEAVHLPPIPTAMEPEHGMSHDCSTGDVMVDDLGVIPIEVGEQWNFDLAVLAQNAEALVVVQPRTLVTVPGPFA